MKSRMTVEYECKKCGTEITVNSAGLKHIDPIYCCGLPLKGRKKATPKATSAKKQKPLSREEPVKKVSRKTSIKALAKPSKNKGVSR